MNNTILGFFALLFTLIIGFLIGYYRCSKSDRCNKEICSYKCEKNEDCNNLMCSKGNCVPSVPITTYTHPMATDITIPATSVVAKSVNVNDNDANSNVNVTSTLDFRDKVNPDTVNVAVASKDQLMADNGDVIVYPKTVVTSMTGSGLQYSEL